MIVKTTTKLASGAMLLGNETSDGKLTSSFGLVSGQSSPIRHPSSVMQNKITSALTLQKTPSIFPSICRVGMPCRSVAYHFQQATFLTMKGAEYGQNA